jgi:peptide/nickel transport system permease protein
MPEPSPNVLYDEPSESVGSIALEAITATTSDDDRRLRRRWKVGFWLACIWLVGLTTLCALAPYLPFVKDPNLPYPGNFKAKPSAEHWLGGDGIGRDTFARILYGGRISLFVGLAVVVLGFLVGGFFGLVAGYFRGRYERVIVACIDVMLAIPALVLALALVAVLSGGKPTLNVVIISLSILSVAPLARITRGSTLTFAQREFVLAARTLGAKNSRIIRKEILPNVLPPMLSFALVVIAIVIVAEGALSFLNLSVQAPKATWGNMISSGKPILDEAPWVALFPAAVMFLTILSLNYVGDSLRARFDVKEGAL